MAEEYGERIVRLEVRDEAREKEIAGMAKKIDEVHALLTQAKGARWAIMTVLGISTTLSGFAAWWFNIGGGPK